MERHAVIPKPIYKQVVKAVQAQLDEQLADSQRAFVALSKGWFSMMQVYEHGRARPIRRQELDKAWPYIIKELGLVDDRTRTQTYTLPGHGILDGGF